VILLNLKTSAFKTKCIGRISAKTSALNALLSLPSNSHKIQRSNSIISPKNLPSSSKLQDCTLRRRFNFQGLETQALSEDKQVSSYRKIEHSIDQLSRYLCRQKCCHFLPAPMMSPLSLPKIKPPKKVATLLPSS